MSLSVTVKAFRKVVEFKINHQVAVMPSDLISLEMAVVHQAAWVRQHVQPVQTEENTTDQHPPLTAVNAMELTDKVHFSHIVVCL